MLLIGAVLAGPLAGFVWLFSVGVAWGFVMPKVRALGQPRVGWGVACVAFPLLTSLLVMYPVSDRGGT